MLTVEQIIDRYSLINCLFNGPFYLALDNNRTGNDVDNQSDISTEAQLFVGDLKHDLIVSNQSLPLKY